jgi:hypothetical protein
MAGPAQARSLRTLAGAPRAFVRRVDPADEQAAHADHLMAMQLAFECANCCPQERYACAIGVPISMDAKETCR